MKLCLFDPGIEDNQGTPSSNLGDLIIQAAVNRELRRSFGTVEPLRISTQTRMVTELMNRVRLSDHLFVGGTNLLSAKMREYKQWQITMADAWRIGRAVLLGVGWWQYQAATDWFTRLVLCGALSWKMQHSVRDEYTLKRLNAIGFKNVINTGCPTMWPLLDFDFTKMPATKADTALLMLTDYAPNPELDTKLYKVIKANYHTVFFWPQGRRDLEYVKDLNFQVSALEHSFNALNEFLQSGPRFDYIGTRLHGGVHCLLTGKRSLVIEVDNRAKEIACDTGLPTAARNDLEAVRRWIAGPVRFSIKMNRSAIDRWRAQFKSKATVGN